MTVASARSVPERGPRRVQECTTSRPSPRRRPRAARAEQSRGSGNRFQASSPTGYLPRPTPAPRARRRASTAVGRPRNDTTRTRGSRSSPTPAAVARHGRASLPRRACGHRPAPAPPSVRDHPPSAVHAQTLPEPQPWSMQSPGHGRRQPPPSTAAGRSASTRSYRPLGTWAGAGAARAGSAARRPGRRAPGAAGSARLAARPPRRKPPSARRRPPTAPARRYRLCSAGAPPSP